MASITKIKLKNGTFRYRATVRLKGAPRQVARFGNREDAERWAKVTESNILQGNHLQSIEADRRTVKELIQRYSEEIETNNPKTFSDRRFHLAWWAEKIGHYHLSKVDRFLIAQYRNELSQKKTKSGKKLSNGTVNRYLSTLSHVFSMAVQEYGWLETNVVFLVQRRRESRGRVRFLSEEERPRLLKACQQNETPYLYIIVSLLLSTGARKMEILTLRWEQIDVSRKSIVLPKTKNGDRRSLYLTDYTLQLIQTLPKVSEYVFPEIENKYWRIPNAFNKVLKQVGITDFKLHDLRHTTASYLAMGGASITEIAEILGHKTLLMVKRYAHLSEPHVASVVNKMNERIFG